jgi:hypothetical protein
LKSTIRPPNFSISSATLRLLSKGTKTKRYPPPPAPRILPPKAPLPILEVEKTSSETKTPEEVSTPEEVLIKEVLEEEETQLTSATDATEPPIVAPPPPEIRAVGTVPTLETKPISTIEVQPTEEKVQLESDSATEPSTVTVDPTGKINFTKDDIKKLANFLVKQKDNPTSE